MICVSQARELVLEGLSPLGSEQVPLAQALGRVTAHPIKTDRPLPPFDRVTMDGYALRAEDLKTTQTLKLTGSVAAGDAPSLSVEPGCCLAVMTGAVLPDQADAVVMIEQTSQEGQQVVFQSPVQQGQNIVPTGSEATRDQVLCPIGVQITAQRVALLASLGQSSVEVYRKPSLAVLSTGNELVELDPSPLAHQIRDCNSWSVFSQIQELGLETYNLGIARDEEQELKEKISEGLASAEILVLSGGVSMGAWDLVPQFLQELGVKQVFHKVKLKPGKPLWFGRGQGKWVFGLPGNPVAVQVCFKLFVEPLILALTGHPTPTQTPMFFPLLGSARKRTDREAYVTARLVNQEGRTWVEEVKLGGSGDFSGLGESQGLFCFALDSFELQEGAMVPFYPWRGLR